MVRITVKNEKGTYALSAGQSAEEALQKLGKLEDMYEALLAERKKTVQKIEELRAQGKNKTATFRQLLAQKLTLTDLLGRFSLWGL